MSAFKGLTSAVKLTMSSAAGKMRSAVSTCEESLYWTAENTRQSVSCSVSHNNYTLYTALTLPMFGLENLCNCPAVSCDLAKTSPNLSALFSRSSLPSVVLLCMYM